VARLRIRTISTAEVRSKTPCTSGHLDSLIASGLKCVPISHNKAVQVPQPAPSRTKRRQHCLSLRVTARNRAEHWEDSCAKASQTYADPLGQTGVQVQLKEGK